MSTKRRNLRGHDHYLDVWHRHNHLKMLIDSRRAFWMSLIDIDSCEYCHLCYEPVALIETKNLDENCKATTVTEKLADRATLPAFLVEYSLLLPIERCNSCGHANEVTRQDITQFRVTDLSTNHRDIKLPTDYAEWLWTLRLRHWKFECDHDLADSMRHYPASEMASLEAENRALKYVIQEKTS